MTFRDFLKICGVRMSGSSCELTLGCDVHKNEAPRSGPAQKQANKRPQ